MKSLYPRRFLPALAALAIAAAPSLTAQSAKEAVARMGTTFYDWDALPVTVTDNGSRRATEDGSTLTLNRLSIHATTLNPGASSHPHPQGHANEEAILVKEGKIQVILNGNIFPAPAGSLIFLASHVLHNLTNVGDTPATYYVVDAYTDATDSVPDKPADVWAPAGKLHSAVFDCESLAASQTSSGSRRKVVDSPTVTLAQFESHLTTLDPGKGTGTLNGRADEVIIVRSGTVAAVVKGVTAVLGAGSFYFQASGDVHEIRNIGTGPASYLVLKFVSDKTPTHSP